MKDIVIIGAGGFGKEVAWIIDRINQKNKEWNLLGFIDTNEEIKGNEIYKSPILGGFEYIDELNSNLYVVCAIGNPIVREKITKKIYDNKFVKFPIIIDPSVIVSNFVEIGEGTIICPGTIVTVDIIIGKHVIINLDCTVGHDSIINDFCTIAPSVNISGNVVLESKVDMGTGSQIIQGKTIGKESIIGAGSVVVKDLPKGCTAVGVPAKVIKFHENPINSEAKL